MPDTMPIRTTEISLDGDYEGWRIKVRTNVPFGRYMEINSALQNAPVDNASAVVNAMYDLLELLIAEWDITDEIGNPIEVSRDGFALLPLDLMMLIGNKAQEAVVKIPLAMSGASPNSSTPEGKRGKRRRSTSS